MGHPCSAVTRDHVLRQNTGYVSFGRSSKLTLSSPRDFTSTAMCQALPVIMIISLMVMAAGHPGMLLFGTQDTGGTNTTIRLLSCPMNRQEKRIWRKRGTILLAGLVTGRPTPPRQSHLAGYMVARRPVQPRLMVCWMDTAGPAKRHQLRQ